MAYQKVRGKRLIDNTFVYGYYVWAIQTNAVQKYYIVSEKEGSIEVAFPTIKRCVGLNKKGEEVYELPRR